MKTIKHDDLVYFGISMVCGDSLVSNRQFPVTLNPKQDIFF